MTIETIEHIWIPLADGTRLAARIFLPAGARSKAVPAILEYIPYRKRDGTRGRDAPMHGYFAQNGYAAVRVDMRGAGDSDGHMADEYLLQEQDDALEVIAWIAAQDWCDGNVGMMGKSWSGFNCLQVAARRPPALKAILTAYSTDDRFRDDIHYMGGNLLNDNLWWGSIMLAYQARPLDPETAGAGWRDAWLKRIEDMPFFPAIWAQHQRYDDYWKHGSVQEDWSAIQVPVMVIGGWADSYTNSVPRLLANLQVPSRGIIGPWGHIYPHDGVPGPAIGFLQEAVRWWDHWLKGADTGVMDEPQLRAFINDAVVPVGTRTDQPGKWVGEAAWPSDQIADKLLHLGAGGRLTETAGVAAQLPVKSPQDHGRAAGEWMGTGCVGEMPTDQRLDDGGSLNFDTDVLEDAVEILGAPVVRLKLSADAPVAQIVVRLSDVLPSGEVLRVSYQVLNLTHRDSHENPQALVPGQDYMVPVTLSACGHRFAPGHKIRVSIGTAYWPMIWPAPYAATVTVDTGGSAISLPVRMGGDGAVAFDAPAHGPAVPITQVDPGMTARSFSFDAITGLATYVTEGRGGLFGEGVVRFDEIGTTIAHNLRRELTIDPRDPLSARYVLRQSYDLGREGWQTRSEITTEMTCDLENFYIAGALVAFENGTEVARRTWHETIARDLM
ncbi:CocE/NonD family hydrolase [Ketogulonicigenium vulgare]|uniref:Hydrolase CocE/NonD family protein n=1 Tax=Ketogulonicigenium vulgare (strain WSH-001) TaxID=759362 RepID=F9YBE5_KETVW|nr:CocE/NonD family hydrolase [Ketogulonicigenium vulgare]AEM42697.1 Hydrolase CocE/NonD family protein [Ketogulonicigenium vulgare WSH-001]ALJ82853.1 peptidase S15 [Ketogulonicigenium vulgare]